MDGSVRDLSKYRFESAKENLAAAKVLLTDSKMIDTAFRLREKADYQDFVIISKEQAGEQLEKAGKIMKIVMPYLEEQWEK